MSHFGRSGPPDIRDTYSLLILNISFKTTADDLFPLFDRYGKVVDIFIPRDRRSGDSRGFAFVRYKHSHEASKAAERLDGKNIDGRNISVQFAKYGREMQTIQRGRITQENINWKKSRSRSPRRSRYRDDRKENDYHRSSRTNDRHDRNSSRRRYRSHTASRSQSRSPVRSREEVRRAEDCQMSEDDRRNPRSRNPDRSASPYDKRDISSRKRSLSIEPHTSSPKGSPKSSLKANIMSEKQSDWRSGSLSKNSDA